MDLNDLRKRLSLGNVGEDLHDFVRRLYPICRSITGDGVRRTLDEVATLVPVDRHEVPSGTPVLDWTVPKEWNIRDAFVKDPSGRKVIDFTQNNLHVVGYSVPVRATLPLSELRPRLHSLPDRPHLVPYRNSFYKADWGFCLTHEALERLPEGDYEVCIDSTLQDGSLTYGEVVVPGREPAEVLISCHVCHPSLANDNLSGIAVATYLCRYLLSFSPRYTYRFTFLPVTIGAITWLARNEAELGRIRHGLVLTLLGDAGGVTYKKSRRGDATIDRAAALALTARGQPHRIQEFFPYGYDERQFCSPGFDLPVGCGMRTPHGCFPEYHTSGDNLDFVKPACLEDSMAAVLEILSVLENDDTFINLKPRGEPQLGRRGIFSALADRKEEGLDMALLCVLSFSDGKHSLLDIARRSGIPIAKLRAAADLLVSRELLAPACG